MTLTNVSEHKLTTFLAADYHIMYHFLEPKAIMDSYFYATNIYMSTKDIVKGWVKEPSKFQQTTTNTYKTKSFRRAYQLLVILACNFYSQQSTETFPEGWEVLLNQVLNEGKSFNWLDLLAQQLKFVVANIQNSLKGRQARFYLSPYLLDAICAHMHSPAWIGLGHRKTIPFTSTVDCSLISTIEDKWRS